MDELLELDARSRRARPESVGPTERASPRAERDQKTQAVSEAERARPPRSRPRGHRRGHPRARRALHAPLRASDPQPDPAPDRAAARRRTRRGSRASAQIAAPRGARPPQRRAARARARGYSMPRLRPALGARARAARCSTPERAGPRRAEPRPATSTCSASDLPSTGATQDLMYAARPDGLRALLAPGAGAGREGRHRPGDGRGGPDRAPAARASRPATSCSTSPAGPATSRASSPARSATRGLVVGHRRLADDARARRRRPRALGPRQPRADPRQRRRAAVRDGSFDAVCCFAALHLFDDPLRGARRDGARARARAGGSR